MHAENWNVRNSIFRIGENPSVWLEVTSDTATGTHAYVTTYSPCWLGREVSSVERTKRRVSALMLPCPLPEPLAVLPAEHRHRKEKRTSFVKRGAPKARLARRAAYLTSPPFRETAKDFWHLRATELNYRRGRQDSKFASKERASRPSRAGEFYFIKRARERFMFIDQRWERD